MKKRTIIFFLSLVFPLLSHSAGLESQLNNVFDSMSNVTTPGVYESQRRGVLTGGSVYARNNIVNTQVVSFAPPSVKAGCGGIDIFGGSFSYIDADQFIQLLRAVASNAAGYAFQLALDTTCPQCMTFINRMQDIVQRLNEYAGNSCQLAQGIVNDASSSFSEKKKNDASLIGMTSGLFDDFTQASSQSNGKDPSHEVAKKGTKAQKERLFGNVVWQSLKKANTIKWFNFYEGEKETKELLMSISGTVIVNEPSEKKDSEAYTDTQYSMVTKHLNPILSLSDLISGNEVSLYECDSDECINPKIKKVKITSLQKQIIKALYGDGNNVGIIRKFNNPMNNALLNNNEKALMEALPQSSASFIRNLSMQSVEGAKIFASRVSGALALQHSYFMMSTMLDTVNHSIASSNLAENKEVEASINLTRLSLQSQYEALGKEYGSVNDLMMTYENVNKNIRKLPIMWEKTQKAGK